jgi:uncharacterized protein (DUF1330 family)
MNNDSIESTIGLLSRHLQGEGDPSTDQLRALLSGNPEGPFHFVNLLAFREHAEYAADHELAGQPISGAEAYDRYGAVALAHVMKRGGRLVTLNNVEQQLIGSGGSWHRVATMEYKDVGAFIDMMIDSEYQAALVHRKAGLAATEVYVTRPLINEPIG